MLGKHIHVKSPGVSSEASKSNKNNPNLSTNCSNLQTIGIDRKEEGGWVFQSRGNLSYTGEEIVVPGKCGCNLARQVKEARIAFWISFSFFSPSKSRRKCVLEGHLIPRRVCYEAAKGKESTGKKRSNRAR